MKIFRIVAVYLLAVGMFLCSCAENGLKMNSGTNPYVQGPEIIFGSSSIDIPLSITVPGEGWSITDGMDDKMNGSISDYVIKQEPAGMGIAVLPGGDTPWNHFSGYADKEKSVSVSDGTWFHSASAGKVITATIILSLIQDGSLQLNDSVSTWFGDEELFAGVTVDHLLSHTSGIATFEIMREFQRVKRVWSEEELVSLVLQEQKKKLFSPGAAFHYSNSGYIMLGIIAEKVSGLTMCDLFTSHIKEKAGLDKIMFLTEENCDSFTTASFYPNGEYIPLSEPSYASGPHSAGAYAGTPYEFARFLNALLAGKILNTFTLQIMMNDLRLCDNSETVKVYYGRGIKLIRIAVPGKNADYVGHSGRYTGFGFTAELFHCIDRDATICIMTNQEVVLDPLLFRLAEDMVN